MFYTVPNLLVQIDGSIINTGLTMETISQPEFKNKGILIIKSESNLSVTFTKEESCMVSVIVIDGVYHRTKNFTKKDITLDHGGMVIKFS